jgi:hypothetical protein
MWMPSHGAVDGLDAVTWQASHIKGVCSQTAQRFRDRLRPQATKRRRVLIDFRSHAGFARRGHAST